MTLEPIEGERGYDPTPWKDDAACLGQPPELWFPERGDSKTAETAKAICRECPVRMDCLDYALDNGEKAGIWGGLAEKQRRKIRMERSKLRLIGRRPLPSPLTLPTMGEGA